MKKLAIIFCLFITGTAIAQKHINLALKKQLDSVMIEDQKYREVMSLLMDPAKSDSTAKALHMTVGAATGKYFGMQNKLDSMNIAFIEGIFARYGYPGKSMVDTPANESAWYIVQHSQKIGKYLPIIKKAADKNELPFRLYAMMLDRDLMNQGKEQIYGTQLRMQKMKNGKMEWFVWPIHNPASVNAQRKKAGFKDSVEENAKRLDVEYKVVTLDEVK